MEKQSNLPALCLMHGRSVVRYAMIALGKYKLLIIFIVQAPMRLQALPP